MDKSKSEIQKVVYFVRHGQIAETPSGKNGYGWDRIFIPQGYSITRASLNEADDQKTYLQIKPFAVLKEYLEMRMKNQ